MWPASKRHVVRTWWDAHCEVCACCSVGDAMVCRLLQLGGWSLVWTDLLSQAISALCLLHPDYLLAGM